MCKINACVDKIAAMINFRRTKPLDLPKHEMIWCDGSLRTFLRRDAFNKPITVRDKFGRYVTPSSFAS